MSYASDAASVRARATRFCDWLLYFRLDWLCHASDDLGQPSQRHINEGSPLSSALMNTGGVEKSFTLSGLGQRVLKTFTGSQRLICALWLLHLPGILALLQSLGGLLGITHTEDDQMSFRAFFSSAVTVVNVNAGFCKFPGSTR